MADTAPDSAAAGAPAADDFVFAPVDDPTDFAHGAPSDGMECMATMEDITEEDKNYCEYQTMPSGKWQPALYSSDVIKRLITTQFGDYIAGVRKADCAADLKRRLAAGPPIWIADKHALPVPEEDTHICRIWFAEDGKEYSAKLKGCVEVRRRRHHRQELAPTPCTRRARWPCSPSPCLPRDIRHRVQNPAAAAGRGARRAVGGAQEVYARRRSG